MTKTSPKPPKAPAAEEAAPVAETPVVAEQAAAPEAAADTTAAEPAPEPSPAPEAPAAEEAAPVAETPEVPEELHTREPATHALMTHPDHGTTDAFPVDPTTGAYFVPFDQVETLVPHGFEVVGEARPTSWSAPEHTASVTLSIGTLVVIDGTIAVPAGLSETDRAGLVANGFKPAEA